LKTIAAVGYIEQSDLHRWPDEPMREMAEGKAEGGR